MQRWELLCDVSSWKFTQCTVFMWPGDGIRYSLTFTLTLFIMFSVKSKFFLDAPDVFCPEMCFVFLFSKTRVRTRQTGIYMCCQWVQTAGISVVLWPYGLESLQSVPECLGYSRLSVIYGFVSSDGLSSSLTQEPFIWWRHRWTWKPLGDINSHAKLNNKVSR